MANIGNEWVFDLESKYFTKMKTLALKKLVGKYPDINFTTNNNNENPSPKFPCVYFHETSGVETGNDIENTTINAILEVFQIEVYTQSSQKDAKYVMSIVADIFKQMNFTITSFPEFNNETTIYRCIMRVQRIIGKGDTV